MTPQDIVDTPAGPRLRVWDGKGEKYRETPLSVQPHSTIDTYADVRSESDDVPFVDVETRTVERWVKTAAETCLGETDDVGWQFLTPHNLRRTWGTLLVEVGVESGMIMEWDGWEDWETFREHYLGAYSAEMQRQQLDKVEWL